MIALLLALTVAAPGPDTTDTYLYRALLIRAAPGSLVEVIALYKERLTVLAAADEEGRGGGRGGGGGGGPFIMRHSQGDQWDLFLLFPMESFESYYSPERIERRAAAGLEAKQSEEDFQRTLGPHIAWREETFVMGPPLEVVSRHFKEKSYYHVEMFVAVPGKRAELLEQRNMENAFYAHLGRPQNLIFTRVAGGAWDMFTLGFYDDLADFAAISNIPDAEQEAAALAAGFQGSGQIGFYLRTLMQWHHDTLARAVR